MNRNGMIAALIVALWAAAAVAQQPLPAHPGYGYGPECAQCSQWSGLLPKVGSALAAYSAYPPPGAIGRCSYGHGCCTQKCGPTCCQKGCCQKGPIQKGHVFQKGCCQKAAIAPKCCAPKCHAPIGCLQKPHCCQKGCCQKPYIAPRCGAPKYHAAKGGGCGHGCGWSRGLLHSFGFFGQYGHCYGGKGHGKGKHGYGYAPSGPSGVDEIPQPRVDQADPFQDDPVRPTSYDFVERPRALYYR